MLAWRAKSLILVVVEFGSFRIWAIALRIWCYVHDEEEQRQTTAYKKNMTEAMKQDHSDETDNISLSYSRSTITYNSISHSSPARRIVGVCVCDVTYLYTTAHNCVARTHIDHECVGRPRRSDPSGSTKHGRYRSHARLLLSS